jgi:protein-S-isoprenylcysteine O-methyltransferase
VRPWLVAAIWLGWFVVAGGAGYARAQPGDRIDDRATRVSVWADLATVVSMLGAVAATIAVPSAALPADPWLTVALGSALVLVGVALRLWAARTLGRYFTRSVLVREGHRVITSGPYRFVRHPGYAGVLVVQVGLALTLGNWLSVGLMVIGVFLAHVPRITAEEAVLEANLGEPYRDYERTRKRLIPGVW